MKLIERTLRNNRARSELNLQLFGHELAVEVSVRRGGGFLHARPFGYEEKCLPLLRAVYVVMLSLLADWAAELALMRVIVVVTEPISTALVVMPRASTTPLNSTWSESFGVLNT